MDIWLIASAYIVDMSLAAIFAIAFTSKSGHTFPDFKLSIASYRIIPGRAIPFVGFAILITELGLCVLFILDLSPLWTGSVAAGLLCAFSAGLLWKKKFLFHDESISCTCFGSISWMNKYPIGRNIALLALVAASAILPDRAFSPANFSILSAAAISLLFAYFYRMHTQWQKKVKLHELLGKIGHIGQSRMTIIAVSYSHPDFKAIDQLLSSPLLQPDRKWLVLLNAPEWLIKVKQRGWGSQVTVLEAHSPVYARWSTVVRSDGEILDLIGEELVPYTEIGMYAKMNAAS
ncbi:MauE/DoxX family redox-associated membrane protein [Paenibacillus sp. GCM10027627]|uniref:MauE/DoxX family redox-associated membrane protein n=1 Tax=unclassified Paenibacillus TaxID=185978 RepID=UPI003632F0EA